MAKAFSDKFIYDDFDDAADIVMATDMDIEASIEKAEENADGKELSGEELINKLEEEGVIPYIDESEDIGVEEVYITGEEEDDSVAVEEVAASELIEEEAMSDEEDLEEDEMLDNILDADIESGKYVKEAVEDDDDVLTEDDELDDMDDLDDLDEEAGVFFGIPDVDYLFGDHKNSVACKDGSCSVSESSGIRFGSPSNENLKDSTVSVEEDDDDWEDDDLFDENAMDEMLESCNKECKECSYKNECKECTLKKECSTKECSDTEDLEEGADDLYDDLEDLDEYDDALNGFSFEKTLF